MAKFTLRGVILMFMILEDCKYLVSSYEPSSNSVAESILEQTLVQDLILDDTNGIIKSLIQVTAKLESLEAKVNGLEKKYEAEKLKSGQLQRLLETTYDSISDMDSNIGEYQAVTTDRINLLEQVLRTVQTDSEDDKQTIASLQKSNNDLVQDSIFINTTLHAICGVNENTINKPAFVSDWILMRAQDPQLTNATVFHGLGMLPYKVDVQIQPTSGPNAGWIFPGDSAFRADDDHNEVYGGVMYFYDNENVYLSVPIKNNNYPSGVIINTGKSNGRRLGSNHQTATEAYVRVRVWAPSDMPEPDMMTGWLPVDISNKSLNYHELSHGFMEYPGLVNVQIRCMSSNDTYIISEGIGAVLGPRQWLNGGGVVHAFNKSSVRIWTGYIADLSVKQDSNYRLFGTVDGWGNVLRGFDLYKGHVRVLAWKQSTITEKSNVFEKYEDKYDITELSTFEHFSAERDLFSLYVQANDGVNQGFRFPGYGNSQATGSPFGGVVYAYNPDGGVRTWRPNPATGGHLIHVYSAYGNGVNTQASNNAVYVSSLLRSK